MLWLLVVEVWCDVCGVMVLYDDEMCIVMFDLVGCGDILDVVW